MAYCGPSNTIPSCEAVPTVGFGSDSCGIGGGYGYGGSGLGLRNYGGTASAASLGVLRGVRPACIIQLPPQEATVQPAPFNITIPGPILSASPQRLKVGGYTPCAVPGSSFGSGGFGYGGFGYGSLGFGGYGLGSLGDDSCGYGNVLFNRRRSVCY